MRPAIFSTQEPPTPIEDVFLKEYVQQLRRQIEVLNIQLENLVTEIKDLKAHRRSEND
jgi:hypothetical protein